MIHLCCQFQIFSQIIFVSTIHLYYFLYCYHFPRHHNRYIVVIFLNLSPKSTIKYREKFGSVYFKLYVIVTNYYRIINNILTTFLFVLQHNKRLTNNNNKTDKNFTRKSTHIVQQLTIKLPIIII